MPTAELIEKTATILATGCVAIASSIISAILSSRYNRKNSILQSEISRRAEERKINLDRLERLYIAFKDWKNFIGIEYLNYLSVMDGKLTYNNVLDLTIKSSASKKINYSELEMLVRVHFPSIIDSFEEVHRAKEKANEFMSEVRKTQGRSTSYSSMIPAFLKAQEQFDKVATEFQDLIVKQAIMPK